MTNFPKNLLNKSKRWYTSVRNIFRKSDGAKKADPNLALQQVVSARKRQGLPTKSQIKYFPQLLSKKEKQIASIAFVIIVITGILLGREFLNSQRLVVPAVGGEYTEGLVGAPQLINPLYSLTSDVDTDLTRLIYSGLMKYDAANGLVPDLAESYTISEDGTIAHKGQYLCTEKGKFPNFEFIRALKNELENDEGTIFRYAAHENTVLNQILVQLQDYTLNEIPDKNELIGFIKSVTHGANHKGGRDMVDMLDLVKKYYYHPSMKGSNSIKAVLPAVLNASEFLKEKYSKPIYGMNSAIISLNFDSGKIWIEKDKNGHVISPYKLLPNLYDGLDSETIDEFIYGDTLADGGAAMTAYAKIQFMNITEQEHTNIANGLLRYCELDTMAMVFIYEYFKELTD